MALNRSASRASLDDGGGSDAGSQRRILMLTPPTGPPTAGQTSATATSVPTSTSGHSPGGQGSEPGVQLLFEDASDVGDADGDGVAAEDLSPGPEGKPGGAGGPGRGAPEPGRKQCVCCKKDAVKGSFCDVHKRVNDNLYTEEKKYKESDPERWKKFMMDRKKLGPDYISLILCAEPVKAGRGRGIKQGSFNAMQEMESIARKTEMNGQLQMKLSNFRMFAKKLADDWGWDVKAAREEFDKLLADVATDDIYEKPTLPGRKMEPWIFVHWDDLLNGIQAVSQLREVNFTGKVKRNPKPEEVAAAEQEVTTCGIDFSDKIFTGMSTLSGALEAMKAGSGSALCDARGRSMLFGQTAVSHRERIPEGDDGKQDKNQTRKKAKHFDMDEALDELHRRNDRVFGAIQKSVSDLASSIYTLLRDEPDQFKDKMARVIQHLQLRAPLLEVICASLSERPTSLEFKALPFQTALQLPDGAWSQLQTRISPKMELEWEALNLCMSACDNALAASASTPPRGDGGAAGQGEQEEQEWLPKLNEAIAEFLSVKGVEDSFFMHSSCERLFQLYGWAGSGFPSAPSNMGDLVHEFEQALKVFPLVCLKTCVFADFEQVAKPLMESRRFKSILPFDAVKLFSSLDIVALETEDELKTYEKDFPNSFDAVKELRDMIKLTFQSAQKQGREIRRSSAKSSTQLERDRIAEAKAKEKEEKARLRLIEDQMKGQGNSKAAKLPGLLAYCGKWIQPTQVFADVDQYLAADHSSIDLQKPFVIASVPALKAEEQSTGSRLNFQMFKVPWCENKSIFQWWLPPPLLIRSPARR